mgnify:CR=1 FL=1
MKDRFRFRVWDKDRKCFFNDDEVVIYPNGEVSFFNADYDFAEIVVNQCTGLKDKNGKLIYDGDLIKSPSNSHVLEVFRYIDGTYMTREYRKDGQNELSVYQFIASDYGIEVIGNIHQNQELLKDEE